MPWNLCLVPETCLSDFTKRNTTTGLHALTHTRHTYFVHMENDTVYKTCTTRTPASVSVAAMYDRKRVTEGRKFALKKIQIHYF